MEAPFSQFISKESEKLSQWLSQTLSAKEAKLHSTDSTAAIGAFSSGASVETVRFEQETLLPPRRPDPTVQAGRSGKTKVNLSGYYTKGEIDEKLEEYYTIEEIDEKFEEYHTKEEIDEKFGEYYTKEEIDATLDKYATKEWVTDALRSYPTWIEADKTYVDWGTFNDFPGSQEFSDAVARVVQSNLGFTIQCNGDGTVTGYLTWGGLRQ